MKTLAWGWIGLILIICFTACEKVTSDTFPGNKEDVALNFYMASDVMETAYGSANSAVAMYVDKYQEQSGPVIPGTGYLFPTFYFGFGGGNQYPATNNGTNDGSVNYVRYDAGDHHLFLTDVTNTIVFDTTIKPTSQNFNCIYFADAAMTKDNQAQYKLVMAEEDRKTVNGKTGVRFIHLSADAGNITCSMQTNNGDLISTQAGEITFGQVSAYQFFDSGAVALGGLLRFTLSNAVNNIKLETGIPFDPGRNYVILIMGFHTDQQRQVATGKNPDGSIKNETITIGNNLRAENRRSY